jgi:mannose-6-phosphate isomerase-like protein (cupin superfamily)
MDSVPVFKYESPDSARRLSIVELGRTDLVRGSVQVWREGGENNLHSHSGQDSFWMVLKGSVTFYGEGDKVLAELGVHEGLFTPRGFRYWFANSSDDPLEMLHVSAFAQNTKEQRTDYNPQRSSGDELERVIAFREG